MPGKIFHSYLYFTRKERRGSLFLLIVVLILCFSPFLFALIFRKNITTPNEFDEQVAALKTKQAVASRRYNDPEKYEEAEYRHYDAPPANNSSYPNTKGALFYFDPNTLTTDGWKRLGLREKTIGTIRNYIARGGKFRQPGDIRKIWGLFPDEAERLLPYVKIASTEPAINTPDKNAGEPVRSTESTKSTFSLPINEGDSSAWIALPGIGPVLSGRIVNFRSKLGGFYSIEQVAETFGLPDSTFQKIKHLLRLSGEVKKINLNAATMEELKSHPYIRYQLANALVQYKMQHGDYKSVEEIKKIMTVTEELFNRVSPYLTVD